MDIQKHLIELFRAGFGSDQQRLDKRYMEKVCQLYLPLDLYRPSELSQRAAMITIPQGRLLINNTHLGSQKTYAMIFPTDSKT